MTSPVGASAGGRFRFAGATSRRTGRRMPTRRARRHRANPARLPHHEPSAPANRRGEPARPAGHLGVATVAPVRAPHRLRRGRTHDLERRGWIVPCTGSAAPRGPGWPSVRQRGHCWPRRRLAPFLGSRSACAAGVHVPEGSNPRSVPSSAFLAPSTVCSSSRLPALFRPVPLMGFSLQSFAPPGQPYAFRRPYPLAVPRYRIPPL
jgi:hypothetical protein